MLSLAGPPLTRTVQLPFPTLHLWFTANGGPETGGRMSPPFMANSGVGTATTKPLCQGTEMLVTLLCYIDHLLIL